MSDTICAAPKDNDLKVAVTICHFEGLSESAQHFILDSWVRQHAHFLHPNPPPMRKIRARCLGLAQRDATTVTLLRFPEEGVGCEKWRIIGWAVRGPADVVHFVYIRKPYRGTGLSYLMLPPGPTIVATHWARKLPLTGQLRLHDGSTVRYIGPDPIPQPNGRPRCT